jgi:hypothetical protein
MPKQRIVWSGNGERRRMDVDLTIRYSDDRLCEIVVYRPREKTPLYRIVGRREHLGASIDEAMREARHLYAAMPWPERHTTVQ